MFHVFGAYKIIICMIFICHVTSILYKSRKRLRKGESPIAAQMRHIYSVLLSPDNIILRAQLWISSLIFHLFRPQLKKSSVFYPIHSDCSNFSSLFGTSFELNSHSQIVYAVRYFGFHGGKDAWFDTVSISMDDSSAFSHARWDTDLTEKMKENWKGVFYEFQS